MKIEHGVLVALGYGKYFKSDSFVGMEPIEDGRGPGRRTNVFIDGILEPVVASRSEGSILRDLVESSEELTRSHEQYQLLADILDSINGVNPMLREIIKTQGDWNLDRLQERIEDVLTEEVG